ncbi:hypothetical protein SISNIDRAFT_487706 [Sistotremastrum niveocremeum HHB9708]|uniref:F-box domain-containing protein n=1 Tax=Sistotremastrum niveocremeum HHB9708 TaxID=1314777 RepID=A0A164RZ80_9AGAM|nr:hypothetical protein SISNIDRAFT_487706 [Sistotremastrum niveocremeum HHB9708]
MGEWAVRELLDDIFSIKLPILRRFVAINESMSHGPITISSTISPVLKVLVLRAIEHPKIFSYRGLTAIHIHEVEFKGQELLSLLEENPSLQILELSAGLCQSDDPADDEFSRPFQHKISTLIVGPLRVQDVKAIFDEVDFQNLSEIRFDIHEEIPALELPARLRPFVQEAVSLKLEEDSSGYFNRLVFQSHPHRSYDITSLTEPSWDGSLRNIWGPILSQSMLSLSASGLTTLEIDIRCLPDNAPWALFFRTCCSSLQHLILSTTDMEPFLDAMNTDIGLLPNLEILNLRGSTIIQKKLVEWLERRELEGGYKLQTLLLPYQNDWEVSWDCVHALAKNVEVLEDVQSSDDSDSDHPVPSSPTSSLES